MRSKCPSDTTSLLLLDILFAIPHCNAESIDFTLTRTCLLGESVSRTTMAKDPESFTVRLPASSYEDTSNVSSNRTNLNDSTAAASTPERDKSMDADDRESTLYGESETASTIGAEKAAFHSEQHAPHSASGSTSRNRYRPQRTPGRKAFVGACEVVNTFIPIDIDHEATTMENSHVNRLGKKFKSKAKVEDRDVKTGVDGTESVMSDRASTIRT